MMKLVKGCLTVFGVLVILLIVFFMWNNYTSPVNEAGREFRRVMKTYKSTEIQSMDDVYERMFVLETHYNSPVFSKMQGGEREEVTQQDMELLFGSPNRVITDVDIPQIDTVYQYDYDDFVLNFHQNDDNIEAFVREDYSSVLYEEEELTALYFDIIQKHLAEGFPNTADIEQFSLEDMWPLIEGSTPTREVYKSGWDIGFQNHIFYFDNGQGENSPEEYLMLELQAEEEFTELQFMERRFNDPFLTLDTKEEVEEKREALLKYDEFERAKKAGEEVAPIYFREMAVDFGEIAKLHYRFRNGEIWISWLILQEDEAMEVRGEVKLTEDTIPEDISDIMELEIQQVNTFNVSNSQVEDFRITADFIGQ